MGPCALSTPFYSIASHLCVCDPFSFLLFPVAVPFLKYFRVCVCVCSFCVPFVRWEEKDRKRGLYTYRSQPIAFIKQKKQEQYRQKKRSIVRSNQIIFLDSLPSPFLPFPPRGPALPALLHILPASLPTHANAQKSNCSFIYLIPSGYTYRRSPYSSLQPFLSQSLPLYLFTLASSARIWSMVALYASWVRGFFKIALPATKKSAPASAISLMLATPTPPSTSRRMS